MVIIQLAGGLGNQMFQYALYLQLKELGREVKIDDVSGFAEDDKRIPALAPFGITYERPFAEELRKMLDSSMLPWHRVRRKLFGRHKKSYFEQSKLFMPEVLTWDDIYLEGYWQTEKYFQPVEKQVREAFDTDKLEAYLKRTGAWNSLAAQYLQEIDNECSVSIHVRGGDYLTPENRALYGDICTDAYYMEGIRRMREKYPGCRFFLFTNDREWAGSQFSQQRGENVSARMSAGGGFSDITWIDLSGAGSSDYTEFVLMSRCRHHILANSSFSWWASYLNKNPEKTVLAPSTWFNGMDCRDFYRTDMCKLTLPGEK